MDKNSAIEKIKKCLALSKSPNEHEAAAALRQAQKLMEIHGVVAEEVDDLAPICDFVDHDDYEFGKRKPLVIASVSSLMCKAFGVSAVWECSPAGKHRIQYFGTKQAVVLAVYSHKVVYRAANSAYRSYLKEYPHLIGVRNVRASFVVGWCLSVAEKVMALNSDPELVERINRKIVDHYGSELKEVGVGSETLYSDVARSGMEHGKDFSINRPLGASS